LLRCSQACGVPVSRQTLYCATFVEQMHQLAVQVWLARTADLPARAIYAPLVNNATGRVLDAP